MKIPNDTKRETAMMIAKIMRTTSVAIYKHSMLPRIGVSSMSFEREESPAGQFEAGTSISRSFGGISNLCVSDGRAIL